MSAITIPFEEKLSFEYSFADFQGADIRKPDLKKNKIGQEIRKDCGLPTMTEPQVVKHFTRLSTQNYSIDANFYPVEEARYSNFKHRPIGIGTQGHADAL